MTIPMGANFEAPSEPAAEPTKVVTADEKGLSQCRLIFKRFIQHKPALISILLFVLIVGFAISATGIFGIPGWWQWNYTSLLPIQNNGMPTLTLWPFSLGDHPFGQNKRRSAEKPRMLTNTILKSCSGA